MNKMITITLLLFLTLKNNPILSWDEEPRSFEFTVGLYTKKRITRIEDTSKYLSSIDLQGDHNFSRLVLSYEQTPNNYLSIIMVSTSDEWEGIRMLRTLKNLEKYKWVKKVFAHKEDPRELSKSDDPMAGQQNHHKIIKTFQAWEFSKGEGIVIAVTDDGADYRHEDLQGSFWKNHLEIQGNEIDDDQNGLIDDFMGWDFTQWDNDPHPQYLGHGTHISGIISAQSNNGIGVTGIAPKTKIMPLKFYSNEDSQRAYSSLIIAEAYSYAIENGAKIITTSYAIDSFKKDPIYQAALDYAYQSGVLVFNSAGNSGTMNPIRADYTNLFLVGNTQTNSTRKDIIAGDSNYGNGIDMMAPGSNILSTSVRNRYVKKTGTSMASPVAASIAALIWSKNQKLSRDQVASILLKSCDPIDQINKKRYHYKLGAGRVNALNAVSLTPTPPTIRKVTKTNKIKIVLQINNVFDPQTFKASSFKLRNLNSKKTIPLILITPYQYASNIIEFQFGLALQAGNYEFIGLSKKLKDPFGNFLDGNNDSIAGDDFKFKFNL